jgi:hypothetical protein
VSWFSTKRSRAPQRQITPNRAVLHSTVVPMGMPELVQHSESVAIGQVLGLAAVGSGRIPGIDLEVPFTDVRIAIDEYITNDLKLSEINVRTLGGLAENGGVDVPDEPRFSPGERVVVFMSKDTGNLFELPDDTFTVEGLTRGKYSVIHENDRDFAVAAQDHSTIELKSLVKEIHDAKFNLNFINQMDPGVDPLTPKVDPLDTTGDASV